MPEGEYISRERILSGLIYYISDKKMKFKEMRETG
jgi:hypothetical protein